MAGRWLTALREREEKSKTLETRTDKTDETPTPRVSSALSVPIRSEIEKFSVSPDPERAAILEVEGGVPAVFANAFATLMDRCPDGVADAQWRQAIDDAGRFLDAWGTAAAGLGWTGADLFARAERGAHGLAWELAGREVIALTETIAVLGPDDRTERAWYGRAGHER